jgi:hypothetical protein
LNRRRKVELYEEIRREYEHGTIKGVARKLGVPADGARVSPLFDAPAINPSQN